MTALSVACLQTTSTTSIARNIALTTPMIEEAARSGASLICLPEVVNLVQGEREMRLAEAHPEETEPALAAYREQAARLGVWIHVGSLVIRQPGQEKFLNRGFLIDPTGAVMARYDKIHMFDVDLKGGERYRESSAFQPGDRAVVAQTPWGAYGMAICYDMRFPHLFRAQAEAGARILTAPSCFTRPTGQAHWHALLRARAIENGCFMIAAAQCGEHEDGRKTYGHSLIVDPWGDVLADGGDAPGVVVAELDLDRVDEVRGMVPSLANSRPFAAPEIVTDTKAAE